ncbi:MAG: hypothetical protein A2600_09940 [Candidatus Lambdaproteobacteria bacterium RIFOXYD1_FULL_56_27]|uniref:TraG N-terminal Proteobacteria domain-containing protein n=1 Tax=Candidatus Lambdaproteobacteria bacterium RIFOXYD2_FULL_56_26 TaxID=1817773 RepID=A0A1F6GUK5_9PROT|nr:MAG: hypothetical protein A2557_11750 [Candidatus Lambdaproteobacteria bacterium RIFOXYD2_FULL_56_26]OGH07400.1 MAG: hypothetical protein A2600_09940 [Candidatus Lambdaproteobacteria bacterium RIFOXYD1_FULL_56_27]
MNQKLKLLGFWIPVFFASTPAFGLTMEYYTWNAYSVMEQALLQTSLIFSDARYHELFGIMILASSLLAATSGTFRALSSGGKTGILAGVWPILAGTVIYLGAVVPKGEIQLHDQVLNKTRLIGGIPEGLVVIMGVFNLVERWGIDLIETTQLNPDMAYSKGAGGIGFEMLAKIAGGNVLKADDRKAEASLDKYLNDCLLFEVARPGTTVDINTIHKTDNWINVLDQAVNPTVYTTNYMTDSAGAQVTCTESWNLSLRGYFNNPGNMETMRKSVCAEAGFAVADPQQYLACQDIIDSSLRISAGKNSPGVASTDYIRQAYMAQTMDRVLTSGPDAAIVANSSRNVMGQGMSTFLVANEFIPIIRAVVTYMVILSVPFLVILMATQAFSKVVAAITGFFVFLTFWGIFDCLLHTAAMIYATGYFESVALNNTGYAAIMMTPDAAGKALGVFGVMRPAAILFASMCASVAGFQTSSVVTSFANQAMQPVSQGAAQGASLSTPEGHGRALSELEQSFGQVTYANNPFEGRVAAQMGNKIESYGSGLAKSADLQKTFDQAGENVQIAQAVHNAKAQAAEKNDMTLAESEAFLAGGNLDSSVQGLEGKNLAAKHQGLPGAAEANRRLQQDNLENDLAVNRVNRQQSKQFGYVNQANRAAAHAKQAGEQREGRLDADQVREKFYGQSPAEMAKQDATGHRISATTADHLRNQGVVWAMEGQSITGEKFDDQGKLQHAHVEGQITPQNLRNYQAQDFGQVFTSALAEGKSEEQAMQEAHDHSETLKPNMNVEADVDSRGRGHWKFSQGASSLTTSNASEISSLKKENLHENRTVIEDSYQADANHAALSGDKKALHTFADSVWVDGKPDFARVDHLADNLVNHIEKSHQVHQNSNHALGIKDDIGIGFGKQSGKDGAGFSLPKIGGLGGAGVNLTHESTRSHSEENDFLRNDLRHQAREIYEKYPDREQANAKMMEWMQTTAQGYEDRSVDRGGSNAAGNAWSDSRELASGIPILGKEKTDYGKK